MLILKTNRILRSLTNKTSRYLSTQTSPEPSGSNDEYTEQPIYPGILDLSYEAKQLRMKQLWHNEVKNLKTVEEKLIKINMPRYYGYQAVLFQNIFPYNCLPLTQHYTRTFFEQVDKFPDFYAKSDSRVDSFIECIKSAVEDSVEHAILYFNEKCAAGLQLTLQEKDKYLGAVIVDQINRTLLTSLAADCPHLSEIDIDLEPRHEAFWFVGGVQPPKRIEKHRDSIKWLKKYAKNPVDRSIQYLGKPYLALRHRLPLESIRTENSMYLEEELRSKIPLYEYDSRTIGYRTVYRHGTNVPGFWPGSPHEFGLISYQPRDYMITRNPNYGVEDTQEALHAQGIQSSFAWLLAQACYQGFSTYNDLTYPLSTQTVITNGIQWSFYGYEMNTTLVHSHQVYDNPKINYCWGTKEMKLFENIDEEGKFTGLNEEVLKCLIHFYVNAPVQRSINMKPYLGENEKFVADIIDDERREFLEDRYKNLVSNRPRARGIPEIYMWERIYKINNKTRPLEPKRRFFELGINPFNRRLDEHTPKYIPKALRPEGPKSKKKWAKTYYP